MARHSFTEVPKVRYQRSLQDLSHGVKTSMNVGTLYPVDITEVLPGDTFKGSVQSVFRVTSAFLKPVIDNLYAEIHTFFVPSRLCYSEFEGVFGDSSPSAYSATELSTIPCTPSVSTVSEGSVADYFGLPLGEIPAGISILPFRAFALIYDQWFRNENVVYSMNVENGEFASNENLNSQPWSPNNYCGMLPKVGKRKDYFTSCNPGRQKGVSPSIPLSFRGDVPVLTGTNDISQINALHYSPIAGNDKDVPVTGNVGYPMYLNKSSVSSPFIGQFYSQDQAISNITTMAVPQIQLSPSNLYVDFENVSSPYTGLQGSVDITSLRYGLALQRMLEIDALYGSRYNEYLLGHFGVSSPDSRLQFTEYLGGTRIPINIQQVAQTSAPTDNNALGEVGAYSLSTGRSKYYKGFVEHGYVITVAFIRQIHTYQQGISKMWSRLTRNDFYDPLFAHLSEQPVYTSEIYATGSSGLKDDIFGFNEAFADYRYQSSRVTGELRSNAENSLDIWHFADYYSSSPVLGTSFNNELPDFVDRTIAVPSTSQDQFLVDFWFNNTAARVMPLYGTPGLNKI